MKLILIMSSLATGLLAGKVWAAATVPEMDGGSALLALGLTVAVVGLIRERMNKR